MLKMERNIAIFGLSNMLFSHRHKGSFPGPLLYLNAVFSGSSGLPELPMYSFFKSMAVRTSVVLLDFPKNREPFGSLSAIHLRSSRTEDGSSSSWGCIDDLVLSRSLTIALRMAGVTIPTSGVFTWTCKAISSMNVLGSTGERSLIQLLSRDALM